MRTLSNAISSGRLAHAFLLTGVRGVGKTSTARIVARALNCIGPDGKGGPTISPCGVCEHCRAIAEDRHVDVLEMDAASRTGIDDIREVISGVRYLPSSARFKIYIIDEVHMLSDKAFNALLKTLEEPPEHVKFIFATTEIRKIPITVLSRCQRFDLRRVEVDVLSRHFFDIAKKEEVEIDPEAMAMICRAADGSVRDGLSILDQAIAHGAGRVEAGEVRSMLGLADRARIFDLYDLVMKGEIGAALTEMDAQYVGGADPSAILSDMLEMTHWLTRAKIAPPDDLSLPEMERVRGVEMARSLSMATLTRNWQILLKGANELNYASRPLQAAEMVLVRLAYAADLPSPADALKTLRDQKGPSSGGAPSNAGGGADPSGSSAMQPMRIAASGGGSADVKASLSPQPQAAPETDGSPQTFVGLIELLAEKKELKLAAELKNLVHLVHYEPGRLEFRPTPTAPSDLAQRLVKLLREWSGRPWMVSLSREEGRPTLRQQELEAESEKRRNAEEHPVVRAVLDAFPGAEVEVVRDLDEQKDASPDIIDGDLQNGEEDE